MHAHNLSSFLYNKYAPSQSFSPVGVRFSLFYRSVWNLASARAPSTPSHLLSPPLLPALVILAMPPFSSLPSLPPTALVPAHVRTHVRTPSTLLQLPIVIHHHPTHKSNNTTIFLPLPSRPVFSRSLCSSFRRTKHGKTTNA